MSSMAKKNKKKKKKINVVKWEQFVDYLNNANKILIVSKGQTETNITNIENNYDICVGIKQSILLLNKKNVLVMNDLEGLFGLEPYISQIKYVICPIRTHVGSKPNNNGNILVFNYLKAHKFKGNIVYYRFRSQENNSLLQLEKTCSGDIIHNFLNKCSNRDKIAIDHLGLYTSLRDNEYITTQITNANVIPSYKNYYESWIKKKYRNKKQTNIRFLSHVHQGVSKQELLNVSQQTLMNKFPNLNMIFYKNLHERNVERKFYCFIPARYSSSRLPGKPLLSINGKTIIQLVYEQVKKCQTIDKIYVLTDDERIQKVVHSFGGESHITGDCLNGTSRIVNFINEKQIECDLIVNVQGDEPFINPKNIDACVNNFIKQSQEDSTIKCSTLHFKHTEEVEIRKRSNGKLVLDKHNNIMYGSRNIIPGLKKEEYNNHTTYWGHIGIFVFEKEYLLKEYLNGNTPYQLAEDIEWLKILEDGYRINSVLVDKESHERGVDTDEDYEFLKQKYSKD